MELTPIIISFLKVVLCLIPLVFLAALIKTPWFKGFIGELIINFTIKLRLDKKNYRLLKNVTFPTEDGTTQIDHILVSQYGLFVIETKNMQGWIYGSNQQKQWTQKNFKHTNKFQNPLHQNYKHTKTLASCLDIPDSKIFSVIVFVGDCEFKTDMPENVMFAGRLIRYIKSKQEILLSQPEVDSITAQIQSERLQPSIKTHQDHVMHVKEIQHKKESTRICPRCGSEMVLRTVKNGANMGQKFWGCSQFPKCLTMVKCA